MPNLLAGRVVMIAGVGAGLGRQTALACAREGAGLALGARTADQMDAVAAEIKDAGGEVITVQGDISDPEYGPRFVRDTIAALGRVDCLVNNAARGPFMPDAFAPLVDADLEGWRRTMDANLFGTLQVTKAVAAAMQDQRSGSIVFVNTVGIWTTPTEQAAYVASKAALLATAQILAKELGPFGVRVNTVAPGWMLGPPVRGLLESFASRNGTTYEDEYDRIAAEIAIRRIPTDADCAGAIVFLASDLSAAVSGHCLDANGGQVCR